MNDYQDGRRDEAYLRGLSQEIKALKAEREQLRAALKQIASIPDFDESEDVVWTDAAIALATAKQIARRALEDNQMTLDDKINNTISYIDKLEAENIKLRAALRELLDAGVIDDEQTTQARVTARRALGEK